MRCTYSLNQALEVGFLVCPIGMQILKIIFQHLILPTFRTGKILTFFVIIHPMPSLPLPFDSNNLYGRSLINYLPYGGFRWLTNDEINNFELMHIADDAEIFRGYVIRYVDNEEIANLEHFKNVYQQLKNIPTKGIMLRLTFRTSTRFALLNEK